MFIITLCDHLIMSIGSKHDVFLDIIYRLNNEDVRYKYDVLYTGDIDQ